MINPQPSAVAFGPLQPDQMPVRRDGKPAGAIKKFDRFDCEAWTYEHNGTSLVGPLHEVKATITRIASG